MNFNALIGDQPLYGFLLVLADLFLKGILILVGARLLTALLSSSAAAARHLIWATALLMILFLPLFTVILPPVNVPLIQQPFQTKAQNSGSHATESAISVKGDMAGVLAGDGLTSVRSASAVPEATAAPQPIVVNNASANNAGYFWMPVVEALKDAHWTTLVTGVWGLGVLFVIVWTLLGITGAWWITRHARQSEEDAWIDLSDEIADRLLVYRPVRLLMSSSISSPMTWGIWRPVILLPIDADDWSQERRRYVLLHEMAHIKRWDTLTQFAAQLGCALHWFNPLAWKSLHLLRIEQEKACDDMVLIHGMKASEYARHLLEIARSLKMPWVSPLNTISMAKPSQLEGRVVDILNPGKKKRTINRMSGALTCVLALSVMLPISALSPWLKESQDSTFKIAGSNTTVQESVAGSPKIAQTRAPVKELTVRELTVRELAVEELTAREDDAEANTSTPRKEVAPADTSEKQRRARAAAIKALRAALNDEHADIRRHAAMTLGEMNDKGSIDALIQLLKNDPDADVRRTAVAALSELSSEKAIDAYRVAIEDNDIDVRRYAVMALADQNDEAAMDALINLLDDPDPDIRRYALMGIADHGGDDVNDLLIKMLDDEDFDIRRHALIELGDRREPRALPAIKMALRDSNPEMRRYAIMAISAFDGKDEESLSIFIELLRNDKDAEVRKYAVMALGEIGDVEAVEALTIALKDVDVEVRRYAAMALSELDYGDDEDGRDNDEDRANDWDSNWDDDNDWEGSEEFDEAMMKLGASAGQFGLAVGELSLNLTSDVLAEIASSLEGIAFEDDLAFLEHKLAMTGAELNDAIYELKNMQFELEEEWSEEAFESILESINELEPVLIANPKLCKQAASIFNRRDDSTKRHTNKRLICGDHLILRE